MTREEALNRIRKIYELANRGESGERDAANTRLAELMAKYDITLEELDSDHEVAYFYHLHGYMNHELFSQVAATRGCLKFIFIGTEDNKKNSLKFKRMYRDIIPRGSNVSFICTPIQFMEITTAYEVYQRSLDEHSEAFFYSFLSKNNLLYGVADPDREVSQKEIDMVRRALLMTEGIDRAEVHRQLNQKINI